MAVEILANGLTFGFVLVLLGVAFTIVVGTTHILNFPQGEVYMVGAFVGAGTVAATSNILVGLIAGVVAAAALNLLVYFAIFYRIRHLPAIRTLLAGIGASFALRALWGNVFGVETKAFPEVSVFRGSFEILGASLPGRLVPLVLLTFGLLLGAYLLLYRTSFGLQVRALSDNGDGAKGIGLPIVKIQAGVFLLAGALSGAAGVLTAWYFGVYQFTMGVQGITLAFVVAIVGGLGSIPGALAAGLAVGVARSLGASWSTAFIDVYPFVFLVAFLLFRPYGLFGKKLEVR
jgi:branched-chain amino acid transport system permease protein